MVGWKCRVWIQRTSIAIHKGVNVCVLEWHIRCMKSLILDYSSIVVLLRYVYHLSVQCHKQFVCGLGLTRAWCKFTLCSLCALLVFFIYFRSAMRKDAFTCVMSWRTAPESRLMDGKCIHRKTAKYWCNLEHIWFPTHCPVKPWSFLAVLRSCPLPT